jgi:hypothetical protein
MAMQKSTVSNRSCRPGILTRPVWFPTIYVRKLVIPFLFLMMVQNVFSQEIQINEDPRIGQLVRNWTNANRANPRVDGWRVQIMATTDRQQVEDARNRFRVQYPDVPAEWAHEKPYYKLRVGAFRSKLEAQAFLASLTGYAGAYPAKDANIHPRDFLEQ